MSFLIAANNNPSVERLPIQIVIGAFDDEETAEQIAEDIQKECGSRAHFHAQMAIVHKDEDFVPHVKTKELGRSTAVVPIATGGVVGAFAGALVGGFSHLFVGPFGFILGAVAFTKVGAAAGTGTVVGAGTVGASQVYCGDVCRPHKVEGMDLKKISNVLCRVLGPQQSAIAIILKEFEVKSANDVAMTEVQATREHLFRQMGLRIYDSLKVGNDITYLVGATPDGILSMRTVQGAEAHDVQRYVLGEDADFTRCGESLDLTAVTAETGLHEDQQAIVPQKTTTTAGKRTPSGTQEELTNSMKTVEKNSPTTRPTLRKDGVPDKVIPLAGEKVQAGTPPERIARPRARPSMVMLRESVSTGSRRFLGLIRRDSEFTNVDL